MRTNAKKSWNRVQNISLEALATTWGESERTGRWLWPILDMKPLSVPIPFGPVEGKFQQPCDPFWRVYRCGLTDILCLVNVRLKTDEATLDKIVMEKGVRFIFNARLYIGRQLLKYDPSLSLHDDPEVSDPPLYLCCSSCRDVFIHDSYHTYDTRQQYALHQDTCDSQRSVFISWSLTFPK